MKPAGKSILTINGGSSSIKFSLYQQGIPLEQLLYGEVANMGKPGAVLNFVNKLTQEKGAVKINDDDADNAATTLFNWLEKQVSFSSLLAVGHRIVHGMKHTDPALITPALLNELKAISAYDPDHLPAEIRLIEQLQQRYPGIKQVACFDTSFHTTLPAVAKLLPIPRRFADKGIQRYGFHGLSYMYLVQELERVAGKRLLKEK